MKRRFHPWQWVLVPLLCLPMSGCAPANREQLIEQVLAADPAFAEVLDKHRELANRADTYSRELALKRKTVEETIAAIRKDLKSSEATVKIKVAETKKQMQFEQQRLDLNLSLAAERLRATQVQRASLGRSIAQLRKSLKGDDGTFTAEERSGQQAQMAAMGRDTARLDHEMAALKEHVRLLKVKLLLIQL